MKTNPTSRRQFISKTSKLALTSCALAACPMLIKGTWLFDEEIPDPKKLDYCGYTCPPDCKMLRATLENNDELKKEAYEEWKMKERYGIEFDPEQVICYGCKADDKPMGITIKNCTVRNCAIEYEFDCCIECNDLTACDKELWQRFPDFHKYVVDLQKKYQAAQRSG
jgi:hypothetical protein